MPKKKSKSGDTPNAEIAEIWTAMQKLKESHAADRMHLLKMSEISLILDRYDDIFSDFDPRSYSERGLSEDFLSEIKKGCRDKANGELQLTFLIPKDHKDPNKEVLIEKRLKNHFQKHYELIRKEVSRIRKNGGLLVLSGSILGVVATLLYPAENTEFLQLFAYVLFEPASWFVVWTGFTDIFHTWKNQKPDLDFYERMSHAKISFAPY